jgi:CAAX prenyl protease-like protein
MPETPTQIASDRDRGIVRDDLAYVLPMLVFLAFVWAGGNWKNLYPQMYVARALIVPILLALFWRSYTKIRWNGWWLGAILGVVSIFQWVGMQLLLQKIAIHHNGETYAPFKPSPDAFDPTKAFSSPAIMWTWIAIRIASASLVVPVMEELFWRDFLWRSFIAPADFKLAKVGEWDWKAYLGVSVAFACVHGNWWLTSIVWALLIGALLLRTKSLGACIVMHGVTNLLLGMYVLYTHDWSFW